MLHEPLIAGEIGGKSSSIRTLSETLLKIKRDIDALIARHTGQAPKKIAAITHRDCFFTAAEAVQFGLADDVRSYAEMLPTPGGN